MFAEYITNTALNDGTVMSHNRKVVGCIVRTGYRQHKLVSVTNT